MRLKFANFWGSKTFVQECNSHSLVQASRSSAILTGLKHQDVFTIRFFIWYLSNKLSTEGTLYLKVSLMILDINSVNITSILFNGCRLDEALSDSFDQQRILISQNGISGRFVWNIVRNLQKGLAIETEKLNFANVSSIFYPERKDTDVSKL